jgi:gliding motility-associated-like protein
VIPVIPLSEIMNKRYIFTIITWLIAVHVFPQMYILNEDFSGANGSTPPPGWTNVVVTGTTDDKWHFDNPGDRILSYPITDPFAIFDADSVSGNGQPEEVSLVSPIFDASTSNFVLLQFVHVLDPGTGGSVTIEAYDGNMWHEVFSSSEDIPDPANEIVDMSAITGGITNARLRFTWTGNGSGFWAVDNIRIYASVPLDAGVVSIDAPASPVVPGMQNVVITLGNFGYNTLTSSKIDWTAGGVPQASYNWNGSIGFGQTQGNITIGSYNFQDPVIVKVWQSMPNGQNDLNPYNDTVSKYLVAALCGSYTVGGSNPDFGSLSQVAEVMNEAGISCPVEFIVRDGIYEEMFELRNIPGVSAINTITFRSESGDSTRSVLKIIPGALKYESMITINGSKYVNFEDLGFITGSSVSYANNAVQINGGSNIGFSNCYFEIKNQFDVGIAALGGSENIQISQNFFESLNGRASSVFISDNLTRNISITGNNFRGTIDWGYSIIRIANFARKVNVAGNSMEKCFRAVNLEKADSITIQGNHINNANEGINAGPYCSYIEISANRLTNIKSHQEVPDGTSGIKVQNTSNSSVYNNFIHTTGTGPVIGITLLNATSCLSSFNSVNITNTDKKAKSKGIYLTENNSVTAKNNIFRISHAGIPVYFDGSIAQLDFDKNDYYSYDNSIGSYNGNRYLNLAEWVNAVGMDENSLSCMPFYTSDTILSINQALLNNTGLPIASISTDIDGLPRNPSNPDIGAKEYTKCAIDAGINAVLSPSNPLNGGMEPVEVQLQNQGTATLTAATIHWSVNNVPQAPFNWSGSLGDGANASVTIGNYDFQPGILYSIKAWTSNPNNSSDCNPYNNEITGRDLAVPLCGNYTIAGSNPDFLTIDDAVVLLNLAGVSCPVVFNIRDGVYYEQLAIFEVMGISETNTVTFTSESHDSTKVVLKIIPEAQKFESMLVLDRSEYLVFKALGLSTGTNLSFANNAVSLSDAKHIRFEGCNIQIKKDSDIGFEIKEGCNDIDIAGSRLISLNPRAVVILVKGEPTRNISITGNNITGATEWLIPTIKIGTKVQSVNISGNHIGNCFQAIYLSDADTVLISENRIDNCNEGIKLDDGCSKVEISGNRLTNIKSHANAADGTSGIIASNCSQVTVNNNFVHSTGAGPVNGINLQNTPQVKVNFNSVNLTNLDIQNKSKGLSIKNSAGVFAKNNIFKMKYSGQAVYISVTNPTLDIDYNDYYSYNHAIGFYNGNTYTDLSSWRTATNLDLHSLSVIPFYTSETDLSINQVLLNNSGIPVTGITVDIDSTLRNPATPDIGAKEDTPCAIDAGINAFTSPVPPLTGGSQEVKVILQNQGTASLSSVKINWQVNDEQQPEYSWSGNLAAMGNTEVLLGTYNFQNGSSFVLKAWTSSPNNNTDCNFKNDTISGMELSGPLCGTYTIGGNDPDFVTLIQAAEVLNSAGITCPVTFLVRDGNYTEKFIIREIQGTSSENTVTFRSESNDSTKVVIRINPGAVNYEPMILLDRSQYIRFENLGFSTGTTSGQSNYAIQLKSAKNIRIGNSYFETKNKSDYALDIQTGSEEVIVSKCRIECLHAESGALNIAGPQTQDVDITENEINGASSWGNTLVKFANNATNINVTGNLVNRCFRALYFSNSDSLNITGNVIKNANQGIYIEFNCNYVTVEANHLTNIKSIQTLPEGTSGIFVQYVSDLEVINNFVQSAGTGPVLGINIQNTTSCLALYNSVNVTNTDAQGKSKGFYLMNNDSLQVRNNIFSIKSLGIPIHIDLNVTHLNIDYNDYYNPAGLVGKIVNVSYSGLFEWGQAVKGDANSKVVNPYFKADSIPLPYQKILNGSGIPIPGIMYDMDGKLRHLQAPDIGCIEFFVDYGILELLSPDLNCFRPDVDSVIVYIRQYGDVPFENLKVAYQLNDGTIHLDTIPGPLVYDHTHTFGTTESISAPGEYLFKVWLINTLDDNINNDTLIAWRYSKPPPAVSFGYNNACTGWEVHFSGTATIEEPYYVTGYEWSFGDGEGSDEQNPVHTYLTSGEYQVSLKAYSNAGCFSEEFISVNVTPDFQGLQLDYTIVNETCQQDGTGSLELFPEGGTPPYTFYLNDVLMTSNPVTSFMPGKYEIRTVDALNCSRTDSIESLTLVAMNPHIIADPVTGFTPLTVNFDFTVDSAATWVWHFSETESDTNKQTTYTFTEYGNHEVILGVNSGPPYYCTETTTINIFVDIVVTIDANSVFTPNEDGFNDFFEVKTVGIKDLDVKIFNQWGNRVYEFTELDGKWDGTTSNGAKATDGTYFYSINARGLNELIYDRKGSVLLLRHGAAAYPNPVTDHVRVESYETMESPVIISVYSIFGQLSQFEIIEDAGNIDINLSHLPGGIYILRVSDGSRDCFVRIIKK